MIKWLQTIVILWEKKKFLTLLELEQNFLEETYFPIITRDLTELRKRLGVLNAYKTKTKENEREIVELNNKINETEKYRSMIEQGRLKKKDLENQIKLYKKELW